MIGTVEFIMSAYHVTLSAALHDFPLVAAAALMPAAVVRNGGDLGPDGLTMRARLAAREAREREIREHYRIID